jgi:hypothetical protein
MAMADEQGDEGVHLTRTQARAGSSPGVMRYILPISLGLVVIIFVVLLLAWR